MQLKPKFKITLKQFNNYKRIKANNFLDFDLDNTDNSNLVTNEQYRILLRLDRMFNFHDRTIKEINDIILEWA